MNIETQPALIYANLDQIRLDPNQPRKLKLDFAPKAAEDLPAPPDVRLPAVPGILSQRDDDDQAALIRLALNILQDGVRTPITVTVAPDDGLYQVVTGERRVTAAMMARRWAQALRSDKSGDLAALGYKLRDGYDYDRIPAIVEEVGDAERFRMQVAENMLRQDMSAEDMGRAWKKMLEDGLFPNVYTIARHFGMEETRIQSHIDLLDMAEDTARLRSMGVTNIDTVGRLLSSLRKARKRGESSPMYDNFVTLWQQHTTQDEDGEPVYPNARRILDLARRKASTQEPVGIGPESAHTDAASVDREAGLPARTAAQETATLLHTHLDLDYHHKGFPVPDDDDLAREFAAEAQAWEGHRVIPGAWSHQQIESAGIGEGLARSAHALKLDRPHQTGVLNIPAMDLTRGQAVKLMAMLGILISEDEVTPMGVVEALQSI